MADVKKSNNCVFLCGAGFSAPFGPPVMNAFMALARRNFFTDETPGYSWLKQCYQMMLDFQQQCLGSAWAFNRNWDNLEELYTQADLLRLATPSDSNDTKAEERCRAIAWAIWDVYIRSTVQTDQTLSNLVDKVIDRGLKPVFVTTNYDLVIERLLGRQQGDFSPFVYPGFAWTPHGVLKESACSASDKSANRIPVVKLHGSANWFYSPQSQPDNKWVAVDLPNNTLHSNSLQIIRDIFSHLRLYVKETTGVEESETSMAPAIVPPMLGKSALSCVIAKHWQAAMAYLAEAREIWIVGYSFPATDAFMKRLLTEGIKGNSDLDCIAIVDLQPEEKWHNRLDDLFPPMMRQTKVQFFQGEASKWLTSMGMHYSKGGMHGTLKTIRTFWSHNHP